MTGKMSGEIAHVIELSDSLEELISRTGHLWLEEGKPEAESILALAKAVHDSLFKVVVDNVFNINCIKVVCPWVEDLEALVLDALLSVSLDVVSNEGKRGLVGLYWVAEVIFIDSFLVVPEEPTDCLNTGSRLEVLRVDQFFEHLLKLAYSSC